MAHSSYPDFIGVAEKDTLQLQIEGIAEELAQKNTQFLFGAGMSRPSGIPSGMELAGKLLDLIYPDMSKPTAAEIENLLCTFPLEAIAEAARGVRPGQKEALRNFLKKEIKSQTGPHSAHKILVNLCNKNYLKRIYTTNFDLLIEDALGHDRSKTIHIDNVRELKDIKSGALPLIPVIHLHGTLDSFFVLTELDIFVDYPDTWEILKNEFMMDLDFNVFVFVGYSMSDPDFRQIYMGYQKKLKIRSDLEKMTYIVNKYKDLNSYRLAKQVWEARKAILLPFDVEDFFKELWETLIRKGIKNLKNKIAKRMNEDLDFLENRINDLKMTFGFTEDDAIYYLDIMTRGRDRKDESKY